MISGLWLCSKGSGTVFCGTKIKPTPWYICCCCCTSNKENSRQNHIWIDIKDSDDDGDATITANYCPMGCGHDPPESYWDYQRFLPANYVFKNPTFKDKIFDCDKVVNLLVAYGRSDEYKLDCSNPTSSWTGSSTKCCSFSTLWQF